MSNAIEAPKRNIGPLSVFLLLIAGIIYSLLFPINRIAMENGVPALGYVVWVSLGGGVIMLIICVLRGKLPFMGRRHLLVYIVGGAIGLAAPMTLLSLAAPRLPSSVITMIIVLAPLLSYLLALPVKSLSVSAGSAWPACSAA